VVVSVTSYTPIQHWKDFVCLSCSLLQNRAVTFILCIPQSGEKRFIRSTTRSGTVSSSE
jgi:hypothetical protein